MSEILRLYPYPSVEMPAKDLYADLVFPGTSTPHEKPHVAINMVATLNGKVSVDGKASPIGSAVDRTIMRNIRSAVDAVVVGSGTVRAEEMNLSVPQELQEKRRANGLKDQPLGVILAGSQTLPLNRKVFSPKNQLVIIVAGGATPESVSREASRRGVRTVRTGSPGHPEPREVLDILKARFEVDNVLLEGGPTINGAFFSSGVVDELFLTLSPKISLSQTDGLTVASNASPNPITQNFVLASTHAHTQEGELFLRYLRRDTDARSLP